MPVSTVDRTLSAWISGAADEVLLAPLQDAERVLYQVFNSSDQLIDPPRQIGQLDRATAEEEEYSPVAKDNGCRTSVQGASDHQERQAPSLESIDRDINTVEIVKKNGKYVVVIDGIAQHLQHTDDEPNRYWLPRFKEGLLDVGANDTGDVKQTRRVVKPILFSLRLEDFETPPSSCVLEAKQRVVNGGVLYMDNQTIKSSELVPFAVNDLSASVTVLPYPLVCTEAPYVTINDYSKVLDAELRLKLDSLERGAKQKLVTLYNILTGKSASEKGTIRATIDATVSFLKLSGQLLAGAASMAKSAVGTYSAYQTLQGFTGNTGVAVTGAAAHVVWNYVRKTMAAHKDISGKTDYFKLTEQEKSVTMGQLASAMESGPVAHKITLTELTSMLYRISETRANGSVITDTDHTLGMSVHDFVRNKWNREAALMQWLMFGEGERSGRNTYTGLYDTKTDALHAAKYVDDAKNTEPTFNTIGRQGMDPLTLANCRTEFSYVIKIKEHDGTYGPTIILDATRINGIDAAWISSGFSEQLYECKKAAQCLRSQLHRLPRVGKYMSGHDTLVSDTNNGLLVASDLSDTQRALLGANLDQFPDTLLSDKRALRKRTEALQSKLSTAEKRRNKHLEKINSIRKRIDEVNKRLAEEERKDNPNQNTIKAKLNERAKKQDEMKKARREQESYDYEVVLMQNRKKRSKELENNQQAFASLFDPELTYLRIVKDILGGQTFDYGSFQPDAPGLDDGNESDNDEDEEVTKTGGDDTETEYIDSEDEEDEYPGFFQSFWNLIYSTAPTRTTTNHVKMARRALAASCAVQETDILSNSSLLVRFMEMLCPLDVHNRDQRFMRFAAFVVPPTPRSSFYDSFQTTHYVRLLPQVMMFSRSLVSTFGNVTILQPQIISDKFFLTPSQSDKSSKSVQQARVALRNTTNVFTELLKHGTVYKGIHKHFCQAYRPNGGVPKSYIRSVLHTDMRTQQTAFDMLSLAFVPSSHVIDDMVLANSAGGSLLSSMNDVASQRSYTGVASLLSGMGLEISPYSVVALASFSEIVSHYLLEHGTSASAVSSVGFELQRYELVSSALRSGCNAAKSIGRFLKESSAKGIHVTDRLSGGNDIAFYCIPGMSRLRVVMRRMDILDGTSYDVSPELCKHVGHALVKLGSTNKHDLYKFPFTCIQSSISTVPYAFSGLGVYRSAVEIHLRAATLSHERCFYASSILSNYKGAVLYVCVDLLYSRPVAIKALLSNRLKAIKVISSNSNIESQKMWSPPAHTFTNQLDIRIRLARLRLDIHTDIKQKHAIHSISVVDDDFKRSVLPELVNDMTRLTFDDLGVYDESNASATYMVPFGLTTTGTTKDILHTKFETHPVWLEHLIAAATSTIIHSTQSASTVLRTDKLDLHGRMLHPNAVKVTHDYLHARMYANVKVMPNDLKHYDESFNAHLKSLESFCDHLGDASNLYNVSGALSKHYKLAMHNAERTYQVCMVLASGVTGQDPHDRRLTALVTPPANTYVPVFAACLCVGNAIAFSECGNPAAVVIAEGGEVKQACAKVKDVCERLMVLGVKAMPFSEICACVSLL